eukprot:NODE_468_length_2213_cov_72.042052_g432_i0.p1 GENE.NODE_468_length_2213_cov_72.042052_g432_i0~~NODE_468_length_2213_cov_72.042052_g432_i0.p1  ORF type:complete len:716 (+),score=149.79 NODE_468_length_2213_cov_72.042052_g432_i0:117-2150(+)
MTNNGTDAAILAMARANGNPHLLPCSGAVPSSTSTTTKSRAALPPSVLKRYANRTVKEFYEHSRLHFISSWKLNLVQQLQLSIAPLTDEDAKRSRFFVHIDMDSFFASVAIRDEPKLADKPLAVAHGSESGGTSEVSSCNYLARDFGVRAGMYLRTAMQLCPGLVVRPYQFAKYAEVMESVFSILRMHTDRMVILSVDEAMLELFGEQEEVLALCQTIRSGIFERTGCTASAGIGRSIMFARLASRRVKPNGQCALVGEDAVSYLSELPVGSLPGVGYQTAGKLKELGISSCQDLQQVSRAVLHQSFGVKTGDCLEAYARGIDNRTLESLAPGTPKSLSCCINYGIRLQPDDNAGVANYLDQLSEELVTKLSSMDLCARRIALKIKKRRADEPEEPSKFMGTGHCDEINKVHAWPQPIQDRCTIASAAKALWTQMKVAPNWVRGIGISLHDVKRLEAAPAMGTLDAFCKPVPPNSAGIHCESDLGPEESIATSSNPPSAQRQEAAKIAGLPVSGAKRKPSTVGRACDKRKQQRLDEWRKSATTSLSNASPKLSSAEPFDRSTLDHQSPPSSSTTASLNNTFFLPVSEADAECLPRYVSRGSSLVDTFLLHMDLRGLLAWLRAFRRRCCNPGNHTISWRAQAAWVSIFDRLLQFAQESVAAYCGEGCRLDVEPIARGG